MLTEQLLILKIFIVKHLTKLFLNLILTGIGQKKNIMNYCLFLAEKKELQDVWEKIKQQKKI